MVHAYIVVHVAPLYRRSEYYVSQILQFKNSVCKHAHKNLSIEKCRLEIAAVQMSEKHFEGWMQIIIIIEEILVLLLTHIDIIKVL